MKEMFLDVNNKLSFSRIICFILIMAYLIAMFFILFTKHELIDIPLQLAGLIAVVYGSNRFSNSNPLNKS